MVTLLSDVSNAAIVRSALVPALMEGGFPSLGVWDLIHEEYIAEVCAVEGGREIQIHLEEYSFLLVEGSWANQQVAGCALPSV